MMEKKRFKFKPYGACMIEPTEKMKSVGFIPMNRRYMSEPVKIGNVDVTIALSAYEYDERLSVDIYEEHEDGSCWGNSKRMEEADLWEKYDYGWKIKKRPFYRPQDIAEAVQRLYPEVETECYFEDIDRTFYYNDPHNFRQQKQEHDIKTAEEDMEF